MKHFLPFCILFLSLSPPVKAQEKTGAEVEKINAVLDAWHQAAAEADFETYFGLMSKDAIFIGTDPTENWEVEEFKAFAKPFFDRGKAWDFTPLERNVFLSKNEKTAWFDELLQTWMGICRGSGVLVKQNGDWKIKHYVLSMTVPNEKTDQVIQLKKDFDKKILGKFN